MQPCKIFTSPLCVLISAAAVRTGGGYLPIISYWYKLQGGSTNGCACDEARKPCPSGAHAGHTFCPSNPAPGQCDTLCDNSTASGSATEAGWIEVRAQPLADDSPRWAAF